MLIQLATVPAIIGIFYMYIRDKYEKEPKSMVTLAFAHGIISTFIIYAVGTVLEMTFFHNESAFYTAFVSSAFVEEIIKFTFLYFVIWKNKNFNEPLDGIVYSVFISLGFAWVENLMYVLHPVMGGLGTGIARAFLSVPSHGLFGVQMGYYFAQAKFKRKNIYLLWAFLVPYLFHGAYNYFLLGQSQLLWIPFAILELFLWSFAHKNVNKLLKLSPFK